MVPRAETYPPYPTTAYAHYRAIAKSGSITDQSGIYPPCLISEPRAYEGEPVVPPYTAPHSTTLLMLSVLQSHYVVPEGIPRYERLQRPVLWDNLSAPLPLPAPSGQRYFKEYLDIGMQFNLRVGKVYDYPNEPYGYGDVQNRKGRKKVLGLNGRPSAALRPGP
nr:hypothetical protein CFP56_02823 [Quercus suber]